MKCNLMLTNAHSLVFKVQKVFNVRNSPLISKRMHPFNS